MEARTLVMELRRRAIKRWVPCGDIYLYLYIYIFIRQVTIAIGIYNINLYK